MEEIKILGYHFALLKPIKKEIVFRLTFDILKPFFSLFGLFDAINNPEQSGKKSNLNKMSTKDKLKFIVVC